MPAWALLQEARSLAGLTQRELARRAGVSQSEVARIERGRQEPSLATLERLIRACGLEFRFELAPRDDHDIRLIEAMLALAPEERLRRAEERSRLLAGARR